VKARGERRRVRSDWMAVERERGISVSSAVMSFEHEGSAQILGPSGRNPIRMKMMVLKSPVSWFIQCCAELPTLTVRVGGSVAS
jgi:hypothetical protein